MNEDVTLDKTTPASEEKPLAMKAGKRAHASARDVVYDFVRKAILLGTYPGGTFIEEEEVCSKVGVSRTPVREAFNRLHADKYIELLPRKGALVRQVSVKELEGMYQARLMVEGTVFEIICQNRPSIPPEIGATIEKMRQLKEVRNPEEQLTFIGLDWHLHSLIVEMCENDVIIDMYKSLRSRYDRVGMIVDMSKDHIEKVYRDHVAIAGMLQSYDAEGLRKTLADHFTINA